MKFYLKFINPIVSFLIFVLCIYAGAKDEKVFNLSNLFDGNFSTYFFAKGLFCGLAIFLLGKILEIMIQKSE